MKGKLVVFLLVVAAAVVLWFFGSHVAARAVERQDFMALYNAAKAAKAKEPLYPKREDAAEEHVAAGISPEEAAVEEGAPGEKPSTAEEVSPDEAAPNEAVALSEETSRKAPAGKGGHRRVGDKSFHEMPYVALIVMPLAHFKTPEAAALAWYWANVVLLVLALFLSIYVLAGGLWVAKRGMFLVPAFAAIPFIASFLASASLVVVALVLVLVGLCLFRRKYDITAGLVTSVAVFSPLGIAFGAYYFLKHSWRAAISFVAGVVVLLVLLPAIVSGPKMAFDQVEGYYGEVVAPYFSQGGAVGPMYDSANQSMWAVLMRHTSGIATLGRQAAKGFGKVYNINFTELGDNWTAVLMALAGMLVLLVSVAGVCRRLTERNMAVVGLEGALVVLSTLLLAIQVRPETMVVVLFPLAAVVYVIRQTELRRTVHHVNYVALVLAVAFFYLALDPRFRTLGSGFTGVFILWIAMLVAINRFRPHLIAGRASTAFGPRSQGVPEKPVDLVRVHTTAGKAEKKGTGLLPLPDFARLEPPLNEPVALADEEPSSGSYAIKSDEEDQAPVDLELLQEETEASQEGGPPKESDQAPEETTSRQEEDGEDRG